MATSVTPAWKLSIERNILAFSRKYKTTYQKTKRELSAYFEIGCLHMVADYYETLNVSLSLENLKDGAYRYLTTPSGNPHNFSYIKGEFRNESFEIRQQVRVCSHLNKDMAFSPDITVIRDASVIQFKKDRDYASGKKKFYTADSKDVISIFECKSMPLFPELMISFLGMVVAAHSWHGKANACGRKSIHMAPGLFVGGSASGLHVRMMKAMKESFCLNLFVNLHYTSFIIGKSDVVKIPKAFMSCPTN